MTTGELFIAMPLWGIFAIVLIIFIGLIATAEKDE